MSMPNTQNQPLCLNFNWQGTKCNITIAKGVIGVTHSGQICQFGNNEMDYVEADWLVLFTYERGQGWLSMKCLKFVEGMNFNGHLLNTEPLLVKEARLMLPSHSKESIDLYLFESLDAWQKEHEALVLAPPTGQDSQFENPKCESSEAVMAQKLAIQLMQLREVEFGLVGVGGQFNPLKSTYNFGALRFDVMDNECWISADDGVLLVNECRLVTSQLYVGDQIKWQDYHWYVVGRSQLKRPVAINEVLKAHKSRQNPDKIKHKVDKKAEESGFTWDSDQERDEFRQKIASWLDVTPGVNALDAPAFYKTVRQAEQKKTFIVPPPELLNQTTLLRLGRKSHAWHDHDIVHKNSIQPCIQPLKEPVRKIPVVLNLTITAAVIVGAICGVVAMSFL